MTAPSTSTARTWLPFAMAAGAARTARRISRMTGRGGTALPGRVLLATHPAALRKLARRAQAHDIVLVSATNGKTTVCAMIATILARAERTVVHNMAGANLRSGLATTLLTAPRGADTALLETDEATLPLVAPDLSPTVIVLGNLFRDQLDRYGELDVLADRWEQTLRELDAARVTVVYNADDPLISHLVAQWSAHVAQSTGRRPRTIACGMTAVDVAADGLPHAVDSVTCRVCGSSLVYANSWVGHLGDWRCSGCDNARPTLDASCTAVELDGLAASTITLELPSRAAIATATAADAAAQFDSRAHAHVSESISARIRIPGMYNVYNALLAAACAIALDVSTDDIAEGLSGVSPAFGRFERIPIPGSGTLTLLLVKNPTGLNEVVRTLVNAKVDLTATLFALNDGIADGRDTSWVWDADIEPLLGVTTSGIIATGDRAAEFALRCVYGGAPADHITVDEDIERALFELLDRAKTFTTHGHAYALVTYTAMLTMREVITRQGWADAYWDRREDHVVATIAGGSSRT